MRVRFCFALSRYDSRSKLFKNSNFIVVREFSIKYLNLDTTVPKKRLASEAVI